MSFSEIIVTAFVVAVVFFAVWRVGQMNPVGTGQLARRLTRVETQIVDLDGRVDGIDASVKALADTVSATNRGVEAMRLEMAADRGVAERTWSAVDRLQNYFIDQALDQAFGRERRP